MSADKFLIRCQKSFLHHHGDGPFNTQTRWLVPGKVVEVYDPWRKITEKYVIKRKKKRIRRIKDKVAV